MPSRRVLLGAALALPVGALMGCSSEAPTPTCGPFGELPTFERAGGALLVSEASGRPGPMPMDPAFHDQLGAWFDHWAQLVAGPNQLWLWPPMETDECTWAGAGRSVALTRIRQGREVLLDLRNAPADPPFWRFIASLNRFFSGVDTTESGRVVLDNQWPVEGPEGQTVGPFTTFQQENPHQVRSLQGILASIHGQDVAIDGQWNSRTRDATREVLAASDLPARLTRPQAWQGLLDAAEQPE